MHDKTIIVLTQNPSGLTCQNCLRHIERHTKNYELFVVRQEPRDFGFAHEINRIVKIAETNNIVLINDDCFVQKKWYEKMDNMKADITGGLCGMEYEKYVCFALALIRKSTFQKIGYLNENYKFGYEDTEYCIRAMQAGLIVTNTNTHSRHLKAKSSFGFKQFNDKINGSLLYWRNKNPIFQYGVIVFILIVDTVNHFAGRTGLVKFFLPILRRLV